MSDSTQAGSVAPRTRDEWGAVPCEGPRQGRRPLRAPRTWLAVLLLAAAPAGATDPASVPGPRLFTTPAERERLDRIRENGPVEPEADAAPPERVAPPEPPPRVHLRGFVRRSDGPEAVWVNEASTVGGAGVGDGIRIDSGHVTNRDVVIRLRGGHTVRLKPGQTWDPERGGVVDALAD